MANENNELNNLVLGFAVMAESASILRDQFIKNGFTRSEAIHMCDIYLRESLRSAMNQTNKDNMED